jgi:hypothetical protein
MARTCFDYTLFGDYLKIIAAHPGAVEFGRNAGIKREGLCLNGGDPLEFLDVPFSRCVESG